MSEPKDKTDIEIEYISKIAERELKCREYWFDSLSADLFGKADSTSQIEFRRFTPLEQTKEFKEFWGKEGERMSILIKGMDMPKDGCHHTITIYADGSVACGMRNNYSAIEIPKHGRLIDADDVLTQTRHSDWANPFEQGKEYGWNKAIEYVGNFAPTVIEGDEE